MWLLGAAGMLLVGGAVALAAGHVGETLAYVYTAAPRYEDQGWARGGERFPSGAAVEVVSAVGSRELAPGFFASADPEVSFDGLHVLFAAKQRREDSWQIWEASVTGGPPRRITNWPEDSIRPLYLPENKIVYSRKTAAGYQLEVLSLAGGEPLRITYAPGNYLSCDVLHDGRVLYEGPQPAGDSPVHDLYTVYPDGSGVETYRCDHGVSRHAGRELASGDIVFVTSKGFARFTSAWATQLNIGLARGGEFAGPLAEVSPAEWLVSYRPDTRAPYSIYRLDPQNGVLAKMSGRPGVEPVMLAAREVPRRFPSALHDWPGANMLCLDAYTSKTTIPAGSIASVRLYSRDEQGQATLLGETAVEHDGSFFLHVPGDRPLRLELRDRAGRVIDAERGWFWMRSGEQRVCVGCHAGPERAPENAVPQVLLRQDVPVRMPAPAPPNHHERPTVVSGVIH